MTVRAVIYFLTIAFIVTVVLGELYPVDGNRFFVPLPSEVIFPVLITLGVCATFMPQHPRVLAGILAIAVAALMMQGSCLNDPVNTRFMVQTPPWTSRFFVFGIFLAIYMGGLPLLNHAMPTVAKSPTGDGHCGGRLTIWSASTVILAVVIVANCFLVVRWRLGCGNPRCQEARIRNLRRALGRIERYLARHRVHRLHWMSLGELARMIGVAKVPYGDEVLMLLQEYEKLRYAPAPPDSVAIENYRQRVSAGAAEHR
jgi:hypothetical protein